MSEFRMLIDGKLVDGPSTLEVINPATEEVLAVCPRADESTLDQAVRAARRAFPGWAALSVAQRAEYVHRFADALEARSAEMASLLTQEQGKPISEAEVEVGASLLFLRELAKYDMSPRALDHGPGKRVEVRRRPLGVVAGIVPWNFPLLIASYKLVMALMPGNTIIVKSAPTTPLTAYKAGEIMADIFPAGVVNVITDANDLGARITAHPDINKVSFTGSTATGKKVMASVAETLKRITLELGGNDAAIVLPDVDPKKAAEGIFAGAFTNAGQICIAIKRVYAHRSVYDALCDELAKLADEAAVDDGLRQGTRIGPLQNRAQFEKVKSYLEVAERDGKVIAGGTLPFEKGFFVRPTVVRDIAANSSLVREEQFGPILPVVAFDNVTEALSNANGTEYGLGGSVWSKDREAAWDIAGRMDSGTIWINQHLDFGPNIPFAGAKESGIGVEWAEEGVNEFTLLIAAEK